MQILLGINKMEKYLIIDYQLAPNGEGDPVLDSISTALLNPASPEPREPVCYSNLQNRQSFEAMILSLIQAIFTESLRFANLCLVAPSPAFFTEILEAECEARGLGLPFVFKNYLNLQDIFARRYARRVDSLQEMMSFYQEVHSVETLKMMRRIILRMSQDGALANKDPAGPTHNDVNIINEERFFKIVGWPFNVKAAEVRQRLIESKDQDKLSVFFINQNGKFSGNVYVSVLACLADQIRQKNKARVGARYIEVKEVDEVELDSAKLKYNLTLQNIRKDFGATQMPQMPFIPQMAQMAHVPIRKLQQPIVKFEPRYRWEGSSLSRRNIPTNRLTEVKRHRRQRLRRESSDSSSSSYGRRKRQSSSRSRSPHQQSYFSQRYHSQQVNYESFGIRIRGLPFSFECGDVLRLVDRYDPLLDHIKMGHRFDKKSGEAAVLFESYRQAYDALSLDGLTILGRYLEVILISEEDYMRFK